MTIKKVHLQELKQLQDISKYTFAESFASDNSENDMNAYLEREFSTEKLTKELTDPYSEFYFAELDKQIIGYLKLNVGASQTELKDKNSLEIERIYVLKQFHGMKIGQKLYEKAIEVANENQVNYVWLGVWEHNPRAIRFYKKNGFVAFDTHIFTLGNDAQTDIMMKLQLR